jgi:hypothetical protein
MLNQQALMVDIRLKGADDAIQQVAGGVASEHV